MKKVLIVTYNWPPSGGINVLRNLKFSKYLRSFGWEPIIYTAKNAEYSYLDEGNFKDIPYGIEIHKKSIIEPFKFFKLITGRKKVPLNNIFMVKDKKSFFDWFGIWIRANFFIPDARALWIRPSINYLTKYLKQNPVDVIFSDGPPHTNTVIAMNVSKILNIPFVADFQDPWTQVDYYQVLPLMKFADKKHKRMEQEAINQASRITIASPTWKSDLEKIGATNVSVLYYGYDEDDFKNISVKPDKNFTLCHSGILGTDRKTTQLFRVLKELSDSYSDFKNNLEIKLIGQVDFEIKQEIETLGLERFCNYFETVSREKSLSEICNSWILLLPINIADNAKGRMPGKFYEYLRAGRPILSFGPADGDVAQIIQEFKAGNNYEYSNYEDLKKYIIFLFKNHYKKNEFKSLVDQEIVTTFSNKNQTKKLSEILNQAISIYS